MSYSKKSTEEKASKTPITDSIMEDISNMISKMLGTDLSYILAPCDRERLNQIRARIGNMEKVLRNVGED